MSCFAGVTELKSLILLKRSRFDLELNVFKSRGKMFASCLSHRGLQNQELKHECFQHYLCHFLAFSLPLLMYILAINVKRNQTGCDSTLGYLRRALQCRKDFPVCLGQVGI